MLASRSDYFKALLSSTWAASTTATCDGQEHDNGVQIVNIGDISASAFDKVLEFVYTDRLRELDVDIAGKRLRCSIPHAVLVYYTSEFNQASKAICLFVVIYCHRCY